MNSLSLRATLGLLLIAVGVMTCAGSEPQDPLAVRRAMARSLDRGDVAAVEKALETIADDGVAAYFRAEIAATRGRLILADSLFGRAAGITSPLQARARVRRAEMMLAAGRTREALADADRTATLLEARDDHPADDWLALGIAYEVLGRERSGQVKDALVGYDRAVAADSGLIEAHLRLGRLFLDKYNGPDAKAAFAEALRRDPGNGRAQLGMAQVALFEGNPASGALLARAAESAPGLAGPRTGLARLELDAEAFDSAAIRAATAIGLDSADLDAWAVLAASALLRDDTAAFATAERQVRAINRAPAAFYAEIGEALGRQRRYRQAAAMAARGVAVAPTDPSALTTLGVNELRLGAIDSGRARLELAFARDPYHVWNKNTLDLLDELAKYRTVRQGRFEFVAAPEEIELLTLYLAPLLEQAYDSLARRYGYGPPTPVRLEIYRRHADFSVRTVGLAGLGALGVSFGSVLAMDAPSARGVGEFNWASTAWHELTHAFTLGATDHRVPRWLSEGLSVLEERRARTGWGAGPSIAWVAALKGGQLNPVSRLNDGFVRPKRPADVGFAYYQASLLCEYLEEKFGFAAVQRLLAGYRGGLGTEAAMSQAIGIGTEALGREFDAWMRSRFAAPLRGVAAMRDSVFDGGELTSLMQSGARLRQSGQVDEAIAVLERADRLFPDMADGESPAWLLAQLHGQKGDTAKALEYLTRVTRFNETQYDANRLEADLRVARRDDRGALAALERAIYIHPYDQALHIQAAEAAARLGDWSRAVRERRAVLALDPSDRAEALYQLAVAHQGAGDRAAARREVLRALELAPSFEKAQTLLLALSGGT